MTATETMVTTTSPPEESEEFKSSYPGVGITADCFSNEDNNNNKNNNSNIPILYTVGYKKDDLKALPPIQQVAIACRGVLVQFLYSSCWVIGVFSPLMVACCLYAQWYNFACFLMTLIIVPYIHPIKPWPTVRRLLPAWAQYGFEECAMHWEEGPPSEVLHDGKPRMLTYHPHGFLSWGFSLNGGFRKECEGCPGVVADGLYHTPFFRWFVVGWTGGVVAANKKSVKSLMRDGKVFGILPGGFEEATISMRGAERVYIKKRKGFVKYGLQFGYNLVPVYTFGESDTYDSVQGGWKLRLWMNAHKMPAVLGWGSPLLFYLPKRVRLNTVVGMPIQLPKIEHPTDEQMDHWHAVYVKELVNLFDKYKGRFASDPSVKLEIW